MSEQDHVIVSTDNGVMTVQLNRPEAKNALTVDMYKAINAAFDHASDATEVRVLVLKGSEDIFTAGNDLVDFMKNPAVTEDAPVYQFLFNLLEFKKPLVAAVSGPAIGVGVTLLMHCDLVLASDTAMLQMPFASLGAVPEAGSSILFPMMVGPQKAAEVFMLSEKINAEDAQRYGLISRVTPVTELNSETEKVCQQLANQPARALRESKRLLKAPYIDQLREHMKEELKAFSEGLQSPEAKEAITAFFEKRQPNFRQFD